MVNQSISIPQTSDRISNIGEISGEISVWISESVQIVQTWIGRFTIFEWIILIFILFLVMGLLYLRTIVKKMQEPKRKNWKMY